jgi:hypothetical protein
LALLEPDFRLPAAVSVWIVDEGDFPEQGKRAVAESHGTEWVVVKLPEAKRGWVWQRVWIREGAA